MAVIKAVALSITTLDDAETGKIAAALVGASAPMFGKSFTLSAAKQMAEDLRTFREAEQLLKKMADAQAPAMIEAKVDAS